MKKRLFVILAVLLASSLILPGQASEFVLEILGNANLDDTIDEKDAAYVEGIIKGKNAATNLSDANCDGKIDSEDINRIKEIILGSEKEITIICNPPYNGAKPQVTIQKPVERIVILHKNAAEVIRALQAEDKVVGLDSNLAKYKTYFSELIDSVPFIGSWMEPDIEAILRVNPDIVIVWTQYPSPSLLEDKLDGTGIAVVRMDLNDPLAMEGEIMQLAYILDKKEEAKEFIYFYKGYIDKISNRTEGIPEEKKLHVMSAFGDNIYAGTGSCPFGGRTMPVIAGATNIAADLVGGQGGYVKVDLEWIIKQNPDCIVRWSSSSNSTGYESDDPAVLRKQLEEITKNPEWKEIAAVKNNRVYQFADIWSSPACFITTAYFAKIFYPDLFKDLDPQAIHQEYLTRFQHLDYDLDNHGIFIYPPVEES
jgi:iron complex transport system substrate-binding protein